ncbi:MAG: hypothetical protein GY936_16350 [Ignavibacteriae bacterium]|nr:hypothetical protein [Ignavibacteriota bacterium]
MLNEIISSNFTSFVDEDGDYSDWIELYNPNDTIVSLYMYSLSDDIAEPLNGFSQILLLTPKVIC